MVDIILEHIKTSLTVPLDDVTFDIELLTYINSSISKLVQLGVDQFVDLEVLGDTVWPDFGGETTLKSLVVSYLFLDVKIIFDTSASATIQTARSNHREEIEGRILVESRTEVVEEVVV